MPRRGPHHDNITWLPHVRVAWGGPLGTTAEVWTNSIKFLPNDSSVLTPAQAATAMPALLAALGQWLANAGDATMHSNISKDAKLSWVKMNAINGDGLQYGDTNILEQAPVPGMGGDSLFVPFYQTYCISLMTAKKRGRAHIGRIYPPAVNSAVIAGTGLQDPLMATAQAKSFSNCLGAMKATIVANYTAGAFSVLSPGDSLKGTVPLASTIIGCSVDNAPDTQHRRTNRLKGVRSATQAS